MPEFTYIARQADGERVEGSMSAQTERDVINSLVGKKLFPVEVSGEKKPISISVGGVSGQVMAIFYAQLSSLLASGVPLLRSLNILKDQTSRPKLRLALEDVSARIEEGETLGEAFRRHPKIFSDIAVNMAVAGGEGGFLEEALDRVATFTEQQTELKNRTVGAMIYPVILFTVGFVVVTGLLVFFVPKFGELFEQLRQKGQLPAATEWLLWFSSWLKGWGIVIGMAIAALLVTAWSFSFKGRGRVYKDILKLKLPLFGSIFRDLAVSRFCRVLGTLLRNGVPILRSLEISRDATGNVILNQAIEGASDNITAGESLAVPLRKSGQFPKTVTEMITVAEESNTLDNVLINIADNLEKQTSRRLDLLVKLLEPVMLMIMAGIILFVVIALLLPVMKLGTALQ
jgi:general secretion pathway protein F/type IV pilus assembly protein PilC